MLSVKFVPLIAQLSRHFDRKKFFSPFVLQSYNEVAEDMRGDEETKAELHQQLDVSTMGLVWFLKLC